MLQMAEYTVNGIGGNGNQGPEPGHGEFVKHVSSNETSMFTKKVTLNLDMDKIARAREEAAAIWSM